MTQSVEQPVRVQREPVARAKTSKVFHRHSLPVSIAIRVGGVLLILVIWQLISTTFYSPVLFPPPTVVFPALWADIVSGDLEAQAGVSLARIGSGFVIGSLAGIILGLLLARVRFVRLATEPFLQFLRFIPVIALLSPFIVWFGIGETSKVMLIVYTTTFIVMLNTTAGVYAISEQKYRAARCFGASEGQVLFGIIVPGTLPYIFTGMRLAMGNSFMTVVSAELVASDAGLGYMINQARLFLDMPTIFVGIITLGVLGFCADILLVILARTVFGRYTRPD
jgi:NitT/TauT family transport system permease protein